MVTFNCGYTIHFKYIDSYRYLALRKYALGHERRVITVHIYAFYTFYIAQQFLIPCQI